MKCPKCGSEMELVAFTTIFSPVFGAPGDEYRCKNPNCGHEEKVEP